MSDVLSAEEIAQLFEAAKDGELPEGPRRRARTRSVRKLDFSRPMKLSLVEQGRFERAHAGFCGDAGARLSGELRSPIELEVINSSQLTWQAALEDVPQPAVVGVVECRPSGGLLLIAMEEALMLRMIDRLLGGSYGDRPQPRDLTPVDRALARHVLDMILAAMTGVWEDLLGLTPQLQEVDSTRASLQNVPPLPPIQPTIELTIETRDQSGSSTILLLVPHTTIETAGKSLGESFLAADVGSDAASIRDAVGAVRVQARAELGTVTMTIGQVLGLKAGDVVRLGTAGQAALSVDGTPLYHARPGLSGNRRAVQIIEPVERGA